MYQYTTSDITTKSKENSERHVLDTHFSLYILDIKEKNSCFFYYYQKAWWDILQIPLSSISKWRNTDCSLFFSFQSENWLAAYYADL